MSGTASTNVNVNVGEVTGSQLVIGDHNVIQTPAGARITLVATGAAPVPRLRPRPFAQIPHLRFALLGRVTELALAAAASPTAPLQLYGPEGVGKTALLKAAAHAPLTAAEGVLYASARRRSVDEVLLNLYEQCWVSDIPFVPSPAQVGGYLADRDALVILDDCGLDRGDLETLLDTAPGCRFLLGSVEPSLSALGRIQALGGLDVESAIALLQRELARPLERRERPAAVSVIDRVDGHPQALIEAAALVNDGLIDLAGLGGAPSAVVERLNAQGLSAAQRRLLAVLGLLDGAAVAGPIAARAAGTPGAEALFPQLEDRGWVKSSSPRYRLIRRLPDDCVEPGDDLMPGLVTSLIGFAEDHQVGPDQVRVEAEAIEAALAGATGQQRWAEAATLARASESKLARSGAWVSWRRVLSSGLEGTRATGDRRGQAHMLHQLGSLAACIGDRGAAVEQLQEALAMREADGDAAGAALTRHNLGQVQGGGGGGRGHEPPDGRGPWRRGFLVPGLIVIVAVIAAVVALSSTGANHAQPVNATEQTTPTSSGPKTNTSPAASSSLSSSRSKTSTTQTPPAPPATISIGIPADGSTVQQGSTHPARYSCSGATTCEGPVSPGQPFDTSSPGSHTFTVRATNRDGKATSSTVKYQVMPVDSTGPTIAITSPKDGGVYTQGSTGNLASYMCTDSGSGVATCTGPMPPGTPVDTSSTGPHSFTVTSTDNAGNSNSQTVNYTVQAPRLQ